MFPIDIDFSRLLEAFKYNPDAPMIFSSGIFLWLFAAFMVIYTLLQHRNTARILFVALFSYYFYYKSSGTYFFLLAIVTVTDFVIAWLMDRTDVRWKRKLWVILSVSVNLGLLCYFKYTNFLGGVIASLMGGQFTALDIFLACRHLFLHLPVVKLYYRCLPERDQAPYQFTGLCLLCFFLSSVGGRPYRAGTRFYSANS